MRKNDITSEEDPRFTLKELAERSGASARTIRYYTTEGLLPPPLSRGRYSSYTVSHLHRLQLIDRLKRLYLPLTAIRDRLSCLTDRQVADLAVQAEPELALSQIGADAQTVATVTQISRVMTIPERATSGAHDSALAAPRTRLMEFTGTQSPLIPEAEGWRRISIAPGIEMHARAGLPPDVERNLGDVIAGARKALATGAPKPNRSARHAHPRGFHLVRHIDRGWGEIGFEYRWESSDGSAPDQAGELTSLESCVLYEVTTYAGNDGTFEDGWFIPPDPPFAGWRFRDPTDGRTAEVGMECFVATHGQAWDRHKIGGRLLPPAEEAVFTCTAVQSYRFYCDACGADEVIPGPRGGPHEIVRACAPSPEYGCWRYTIEKHGFSAWMDVDEAGFVADSLGLDFGPW